MSNCEILVDDIKWFMFDGSLREVKNDMGFSHGLKFVKWGGDQVSIIVADRDGNEYRIRITEE